jgi:hypothetical protein
VVDLAAMTVTSDVLLTVFSAFARTAAGWPGCPVVLCAASKTLRADLTRMAITRAIPVYLDRSAAIAAAAGCLPLTDSSCTYPQTGDACASARDLVASACREWRVPQVADEAQLLVTELVSNAVRYGGGDITLRVALGDYFLHVSWTTPAPTRHGEGSPTPTTARAAAD